MTKGQLIPSRVQEIMNDSLVSPVEVLDGTPAGFHPERLESHREEVATMLRLMPIGEDVRGKDWHLRLLWALAEALGLNENKPTPQTIGGGTFTSGDPQAGDGPFNDVRDLLVKAPKFGGHGYATLDLFPVRHKIIRELDPPPMAVFEFGSLLGYFLMTACDAAPSITRVGWIDPEIDQPGSNKMCAENVHYVFEQRGEVPQWIWYDQITRNCRDFDFADLVQVDGAHTYTDCITDLYWALELRPTNGEMTIMVDDYKAISEVKRATDDFARIIGRRVEYHETRNGLAVLRDVKPPPSSKQLEWPGAPS